MFAVKRIVYLLTSILFDIKRKRTMKRKTITNLA